MEDETIIQTIGHDITDRIRNGEKLIKSREKYQRALSKISFYEDLFRHNMKNILQGILSSVNLISILKNDPKKEVEIQEILEIIEKEAKRGAKFISDVQILSNLEEFEASLKRIDALELLQKAINITHEDFSKKEIHFSIDTKLDNIWVEADEFLLNVFENIFYLAVRGNSNLIIKIRIKISKIKKNEKEFIHFQFMDNNEMGLSEEKKQVLLDKTPPLKVSKEGVGLELLLIKTLIARYGGEIVITDKIEGIPSKGVALIILLKSSKSV
ncbi:MAG: hypothetical protein ACTSU4_06395 [Promethearchaeota archaeon]